MGFALGRHRQLVCQQVCSLPALCVQPELQLPVALLIALCQHPGLKHGTKAKFCTASPRILTSKFPFSLWPHAHAQTAST